MLHHVITYLTKTKLTLTAWLCQCLTSLWLQFIEVCGQIFMHSSQSGLRSELWLFAGLSFLFQSFFWRFSSSSFSCHTDLKCDSKKLWYPEEFMVKHNDCKVPRYCKQIILCQDIVPELLQFVHMQLCSAAMFLSRGTTTLDVSFHTCYNS